MKAFDGDTITVTGFEIRDIGSRVRPWDKHAAD